MIRTRAGIRRYEARMDQLQTAYWDSYDRWLLGDTTTAQLEAAHTALIDEWLTGLDQP